MDTRLTCGLLTEIQLAAKMCAASSVGAAPVYKAGASSCPGVHMPCWLAVVLTGLGISVVIVVCFAWLVRKG